MKKVMLVFALVVGLGFFGFVPQGNGQMGPGMMGQGHGKRRVLLRRGLNNPGNGISAPTAVNPFQGGVMAPVTAWAVTAWVLVRQAGECSPA